MSGSDDLQARIFGRQPVPPTTGIPGRDLQAQNATRAIFQHQSPSSVDFGEIKVTDRELASVQLLIRQLGALFQNANITAALPAHNQETWWSQPVDLSVNFTLGINPAPYATAITYLCQQGTRIRINGYGVNVKDPAYTYNGDILWRITKNGTPIQNLSDWGQQRGTVVQPRNTFIILSPGDSIAFQVRRTVAVLTPQVIEMALVGYTWKPRKDYEGYRASINAG